MKDVIIVGAGHLGVDVFCLLDKINSISPKWNVKGFINDVPVDLSRYRLPIDIVGTIEGYQPTQNEVLVMAIGSPNGKESVARKLISRGAVFEKVIDPSVIVSSTAQIGTGSIVFGGSMVAPCAKVGKFTCIGNSSIIGMDSVLGDYSNTAAWVNIYQGVKVGNKCQLWSSSVILNTVGDDAVVGAGSVVISKVRPGTKVFGNPAKRMDF